MATKEEVEAVREAGRQFYLKLADLIKTQREWSEKQFGSARERDARGPLDHLRKECLELAELVAQANAGTLPPEKTIDSEIADLLILFLDVLWRSRRKFAQAMDAATAKLEENKARQWPEYRGWRVLFGLNLRPKNPDRKFSAEAVREGGYHPRDVEFVGWGATEEAATEDVFRRIRDANARAVEHVRAPVCVHCGGGPLVHFAETPNIKEHWGCKRCGHFFDKDSRVSRLKPGEVGPPPPFATPEQVEEIFKEYPNE